MNPQLVPPATAANYIGRTPGTLQSWRSTGKHNLPYIKSGGRVLYRLSDLDSWLEKRTYTHSGEYMS